MTTTNNPAKRAAELYKRKARLKALLTRVEAQIKQVATPAMDWMLDQGMLNAPFKALGTVYMRDEVWASVAKDVPMGKVKAAIRKAGHNPEDIIKENANQQTLSAFVRELLAEVGDPEDTFEEKVKKLPKGLQSTLKITHTTKLGFRSNG